MSSSRSEPGQGRATFRLPAPWAWGLLVFAFSFFIRLATVAAMRELNTGPVGVPSHDDVDFHLLASHLADGTGYWIVDGRPTSFRAPGFPLFLAGVYLLAPGSAPAAYLSFCLLGAITCVLVYLLARELFAEGWARAAGFLAAVYLPHIYFATSFISENLFAPCSAFGMWLLVRWARRPSTILLAGAALCFGWAALARPFALILLPVYMAVFVRRGLWRGAGDAVLFTVAFLAVIAPWTVRNYLVHGRPVLVATNGGSTFYGGNNGRVLAEPRYWGYWLSTVELPHRDLIDAAPDEVSHDAVEWRLGVNWLREHWEYVPLLGLFKLLRLWIWPPDFDPGYRLLRLVAYAPFWLAFSLGVLTVIRDGRYRTSVWNIVHAPMLATIITALVFWGCPRFRDVNVPSLMLYSVLGLQVACQTGRHLFAGRVAGRHKWVFLRRSAARLL